MYLSSLLVNIGEKPDGPRRPGQLWLQNLYRVHQRLCMAFPSAARKSEDEHFLKPFRPQDFGEGHVHVPRRSDAGFLFRIDPQPGGRAVILVQSAAKPNWEYAFHNADYLLAAPPEVKAFDPRFTKGQQLRFRLLANPTKRFSKNSCERDGKPVAEKWVGKRVPVPAEQLEEWLTRRATAAGFSIDKDSLTIQPGYVSVNKTPSNQGQRLRSVRYDGILDVTDPALLEEAIVRGIGSGKAFGFGLLSVSPVKPLISGSQKNRVAKAGRQYKEGGCLIFWCRKTEKEFLKRRWGRMGRSMEECDGILQYCPHKRGGEPRNSADRKNTVPLSPQAWG